MGALFFALNPDIARQNRGVSPENERGAQVYPDVFFGRKCGYLACKYPVFAFFKTRCVCWFLEMVVDFQAFLGI